MPPGPPFTPPHFQLQLSTLYLYPLNDTFIPKYIPLIGNQPVKIGRQTGAKTFPAERNGYFDSKAISSQHAEIWEHGSKIYIKDVKSSSGTFVNGERLSPEGVESEPFLLQNDDVVEFGSDVIGEDDKTTTYYKVAARVMCVFTEEEAQLAARLDQIQSNFDHPTISAQQSGADGDPQFSFGQGHAAPPAAQRRPMLLSLRSRVLGVVGGMDGSVRPAVKSGLSFDRFLSRFQLQERRDTGAELHSIATTMSGLQGILGGALPPTLPPLPHNLPSVRPSQPPESGTISLSVPSELRTQPQETQASLACHVDGVHHVVPTLLYETLLSANKKIGTLMTQFRRQANDEGAQLCSTSPDGKPETAWDVVQVLLADCNNIDGNVGVTANHYVIFVVGSKAVRKSWFTGQLSKNHDKVQHPYTKHVESWRYNFKIGSDDIIVVDITSFHAKRMNLDAGETVVADLLPSPPNHEDVETETMVTDRLKQKFPKECHPGILYLHSLSDPTPGDMLMSRHLESFAKAFTNNFTVPSRVYVVPMSKPDSTLPSETLRERLLRLNTMVESLNDNGNRGWHASIFPGVFEGQPEIAWSATLLLLKDITEAQAKEPTVSLRPALKHMPLQLPDGRLALKDLADRLVEEFRGKRRNGDQDAIITLGRTALECTPEHSQRDHTLINLADLLSERFEKEGMKEDLDETIMLRRAVSEYFPTYNPQRQKNLDDYLYVRFKREGSMVDLEEIVSLRRAALERTRLESRCRPLLSLADSLHEKFQKQRLVGDIDEAISLSRIALGLCYSGHPDQALSQGCLARCLKAKVRTGGGRSRPKRAQVDPSSSRSFDIKHFIKKVFFETVENLPPRLLHTPTGVMCNRDSQLSYFEGSPQYKWLLSASSSLSRQQLQTEIGSAVTDFFQIAMLSHRWGSGEPLLREIEDKKIYDLRGTDGLAKLQDFCLLALERNFQWAWSDTCCIDKDSSAELQEAIGSMFSWYRRSSLTIVYLSDVFDAGSLANCVWFTRGWTLQELLASPAVLFYMSDWSLYAKSATANHKTDPAVLEELQKATGVVKQHLTNFYPGLDDARSRLHWASRRRTTRPEDIAYSLFGIFKVHLPVLYGESAENALGRLLAEIISRSGDVSVLDWVGEPSSFNSCFPANLVPYQAVPHIQLIPNDPAMRSGLDFEKTQKLYSKLAALPRAGFVNNKLTLPSIIHRVTAFRLQSFSTSPSRYTYEVHASRLTPLEVTLSVNLDEGTGRYILVRPWHPKSLPTQIGSDDDAVWEQLEQLKQPFNALLLEMLRHNEYMRIASDCMITACVQDLASILDTEVLVPEIV